jgi:o-succinylbenzoate---CoA ligase
MDPLKEMAWALPDAVAVEAPDGRWTHAAFDTEVDLLARRLASVGAGPRVRVAPLLPLRPELISLIHAVPRTGAVLSPLNPRWTAPEIRRTLEALEPVILVCDSSTEALALEALGGRHVGDGPIGFGSPGGTGRYRLVTLGAASQVRAPIEDGFDEGRVGLPPSGARLLSSLEVSDGDLPGRRNEDVMAVLWTSGSSGIPRGVEITLDNLRVSARASRKALGLRPSDAWLASLSPAHVGGLALVLRAPVVGCRLVVRGDFQAESFNTAVDAGQITHASLVPTMLHMALDERGATPPPESFRCVLLGGARAPLPLLERARGVGFPVALTYGMTETSSQVSTALPELVRRKPGTVGSPLPGVQVRVPREGGEILVRGPVVALRYLGSASPLADSEGWLRTGDVGRVDEEGHLWITGRISDRIISGGVNVDPVEVEKVLAAHPDVSEAVVVGIPDHLWGERVVAVIVPGPLAAGADGWERLLREVDLLARRELAPGKRPRGYIRLESLPVGANGKVDRRTLALRADQLARQARGEGTGDRTPGSPAG